MSDGKLFLIIYFIGWIIFSLGYYIYKVYIDKDIHVNKKIHAWYGFWSGIFSWLGIYFIITFFIIGVCLELNDWVINKLKN